MKTIEQAQNEHSLFKDGDGFSFSAGVEFSQRWIPIEEELPTVSRVLVKTIEGHVFTAEYRNGKFLTDYFGTKFNVTHWRPITWL